ncbi:MAG TPA: hypothetical protein VIS77_06975 [Burkholderiales bacterium]
MILLQRIAGAFVGLALFVAAFVFASVVLAVVATVGLVLWGWLWWRTRDLRRAAAARRDAMGNGPAGAGDGTVVEGEVIREETRIERRPGTPEDNGPARR